MNNNINIVIEKIKSEYPEIHIDCEYLDEYNLYEIWHDKKELKEDKSFQSFVGNIIKEYLYSNNIYNFFIDYNEEKSNKMAYKIVDWINVIIYKENK